MYYYGWKPSIPDQRDLLYAPTNIKLPESVDLRSLCPPVYNQGQLGSCTANAVAGALDFERHKQDESFIGPSRLFIYYNERMDDGTVKSDAGATIRESVKAVSKYGACPEVEWPYQIKNFTEKPAPPCYTDAIKYEVLIYHRVSAQDIKEVLATGRPVVIGISVYESFESPTVASTGLVPMPKPNEQLMGGHAVLVVGYEQDKYIVRNSWGDQWGDKGYFYLPQEYLSNPFLASDFWTLMEVK